MQEQNNEEKILLLHHKQQPLCTTRLPYRQGRKLTAVKVYSISKESNHLLIFGVPSLNLRQETKALFSKFGKLLQFNISKEHASESFTETYHAQYERIQSARHAKRLVDTKNFYGGSLHVCYAPELEHVNETRQKLMQRQRDVIFRLKNLNNEQKKPIETKDVPVTETYELRNINHEPINPNINQTGGKELIKLNMGDVNPICIGDQIKLVSKKRKMKDNKKFQPCFINSSNKKIKSHNITESNVTVSNSEIKYDGNVVKSNITSSNTQCNITECNIADGNIEVVDCTGVEEEIITNINEHLNYNNFGNEIIRKVPPKPVNKIQFHLNKKP
ncbi:RNA-binding protein 48 [Maniola jurtina]|uniref:RNA-binding protein 48 n=1 Tax=Maniola jurtina TaxID=191418 RepID=UPI001E68D656|nr:RNA-binding protein 48 [Maniola jurtina]